MDELFIRIGAIVAAACLSHGAYAAEALALASGQTVYAYGELETPEAFRKNACNEYVFATPDFSLLEDGRYIMRNGSRIVADDSCLFLQDGEAELADGAEVEFYLTGPNGVIVLRRDGETYRRVYKERLRLKNGQEFSVAPDSYIDDYGSFDGEHIIYEGRN